MGFIFYILGAIGSIGSTIGLSFLWMGDMMSNMIGPFRYSPGFYALIPMIAYFILTIGFTIWSWITYNNIKQGKYSKSRTPTLILGIFGLFLAWFIGGIFLLLAYGKLGNTINPPKSTQPSTQHAGRICVNCGRPVAWEAKFCEYCGNNLVK